MLQVLLSLTDNWQQTGGADEFVRWAQAGSAQKLTHEVMSVHSAPSATRGQGSEYGAHCKGYVALRPPTDAKPCSGDQHEG